MLSVAQLTLWNPTPKDSQFSGFIKSSCTGDGESRKPPLFPHLSFIAALQSSASLESAWKKNGCSHFHFTWGRSTSKAYYYLLHIKYVWPRLPPPVLFSYLPLVIEKAHLMLELSYHAWADISSLSWAHLPLNGNSKYLVGMLQILQWAHSASKHTMFNNDNPMMIQA